jgi:hypothetical protein
MLEALRLIVARSPMAGHDAVQTLRAYHARSPILGTRYALVLEQALADPDAQFTPEERQLLADAIVTGPIEGGDDGARDQTVRFRATAAEVEALRQAAGPAGQTISEYVRHCCGL